MVTGVTEWRSGHSGRSGPLRPRQAHSLNLKVMGRQGFNWHVFSHATSSITPCHMVHTAHSSYICIQMQIVLWIRMMCLSSEKFVLWIGDLSPTIWVFLVLWLLGLRCYSIGGLFWLLYLSVVSSVCCVVYCGQMVHDRPIVCMEVE